jgi:hypothetical protein
MSRVASASTTGRCAIIASTRRQLRGCAGYGFASRAFMGSGLERSGRPRGEVPPCSTSLQAARAGAKTTVRLSSRRPRFGRRIRHQGMIRDWLARDVFTPQVLKLQAADQPLVPLEPVALTRQ